MSVRGCLACLLIQKGPVLCGWYRFLDRQSLDHVRKLPGPGVNQKALIPPQLLLQILTSVPALTTPKDGVQPGS